MPRFYETVSVDTDVDIDISVNDFFQEMSSNDAEEMFDLLLENGYEPNSLDFSYLIKNRNFLKEFSYQMKFSNSDNLEFLLEELQYGIN